MLDYRGDIQICRALAVSLVLLFHLGLPGFQSGFLGVDVFFVISGYLMAKLHGPGATAVSFYQRRAKRLLAAYFATVIGTLAAAFWIVLPQDFARTAEQAIYAATFTSNVGYWAQNSYFDQSDFNPLLHLWSLGVEIQFYLLFPLVAWLCRGRRWLLVLLVAGSLAFCFACLLVSPKVAFFMLPARFWQFGLGMLAASWSVCPSPRAGIVGIAAMLAIPLIPLDPKALSVIAGHPGLAALGISLATALVMIARLPDALVSSVGGRLAQRLGNISYSLYLTHWPILVFLNYVPFGGTATSNGTISGLVIGLALIIPATALLYRVFERAGARVYTPWRAASLASASIGLALILPTVQRERFPQDLRPVFAALEDRATYRCGKVFRITHFGEQFCRLGEGSRAVMLVGDSHADSLKVSFAKMASKRGYATLFGVANDPLLNPGNSPQWLLGEVRRLKPEMVYFHFSPKRLESSKALEAARLLKRAGYRVALIAPIPVYESSVPNMLYQQRTQGTPLQQRTLAQYQQVLEERLAEFREFGIDVIDTAPAFCTPRCALASQDGRLFYFDGGHLTLTGGTVLEPVLFDHIGPVTAGG